MNYPVEHEWKLDNPVWHALNETHERFGITYDNLKCYHPNYCPFGGFIGYTDVARLLDQYAAIADEFFIIGNKPEFSEKISLKNELVCLQLICRSMPAIEIKETIVPLNENHAGELFSLVTLVQPGYFRRKTHELGNYFGIFKNNMLVAVTGERMKLNGFTELSAIVTHPEHVGNGYASQLTAYVAEKVLQEGKIPFLHVTEPNQNAINLYIKLGFETRRKISFWHFEQRSTV